MQDPRLCSGTCTINDWAKDPHRAGFKRTVTLQVGGDGTSVIIMATHEDGRRIRMNFSGSEARRLLLDLQAATTMPAPGFDPYGVMK